MTKTSSPPLDLREIHSRIDAAMGSSGLDMAMALFGMDAARHAVKVAIAEEGPLSGFDARLEGPMFSIELVHANGSRDTYRMAVR